jgi:dihydrolipoamide dehydrogenase
VHPSKALLHASEMFEAAAKDFAGMGIKVTPELDLPAMMKSKSDSVGQLTKGVEFLFRKNKVEYVQGEGRIAGPARSPFAGWTGRSARSRPRTSSSPPAASRRPCPAWWSIRSGSWTRPACWSCRPCPKTMIVIGAGIIGLELAASGGRSAPGDRGGVPGPHHPGMDEETPRPSSGPSPSRA